MQDNHDQHNHHEHSHHQQGEQGRESEDPPRGLWQRIRSKLAENGVVIGINNLEELESLGLEDLEIDLGDLASGLKVVCVASDLKSSAEEMSAKQRDQVVMVRVDEETRDHLDAWVKTGAVKSRSEAAALFIREGLEVRADELEKLREALREVEDAQTRLQQKANEVLSGTEVS